MFKFNKNTFSKANKIFKKCFSSTAFKKHNSKIFLLASSLVSTSLIYNYYNQEDRNQDVNGDENAQNNKKYHYKYVIVGGGTAGFAALMGIREVDKNTEVLVLSEDDRYYNKTQLSKGLWRASDEQINDGYKYTTKKGTNASVLYPPAIYNAATIWNNKADHVDLNNKFVLVGDKVVHFDKILIATGGHPKRLYGVEDEVKDRVQSFQTLRDFDNLRKIVAEANPSNPKTIMVVGGNYLGSELTSELSSYRDKGVHVIQVFREAAPLARFLPDYLSNLLLNQGIDRGVTFFTGRSIERVERHGSAMDAVLDDGKRIQCDHIVTALGNQPNSDIMYGNGIELDAENAIVVNIECQARSNVWAAGDVASIFSLGGRDRFRHHNDAIESGFIAGRNMAGGTEALLFHPLYSSDIFGVQFDVVGKIHSSFNTYGIWSKSDDELSVSPQVEVPALLDASQQELSEEERHSLQLSLLPTEDLTTNPSRSFNRPGIVYYTNNQDSIVGILLWNIVTKKKKNTTEKAMDLLLEQTKVRDLLEAHSLVPLINPQDKYEDY